MDQHWKNISENLTLSDEGRERIRAQLAARPMQREVISMRKKTISKLRSPLLAAALATALAVTAFAVELTVGWESFLGRAPQEAITSVGVSAVTGDYTLTLRESIVDDTGAAFLLALSRNDGRTLEGKPELSHWDVKVEGEFPDMSGGSWRPIRAEDGKTVYYCAEFEAQGENWEEDKVTGKTITFQCDRVVDMDWSEEELAMTKETVSLAALAQTARQVEMSRTALNAGENESAVLALVEELSAQAGIPLTRPGEGATQVSAVFFSGDGCPMVAVDDWSGAVWQGQYRFSCAIATILTDTRTGEQWRYQSSALRGEGENRYQLSDFGGCPLTLEDLPYVEVTVTYSIDKVLSDESAELSFTAGDGYQRTVALDEEIAFNYIGDCAVHVTGADISALRLQLTFDQMERSGWNWEDHKVRETQWALIEQDGTQVLLFSPMIRYDEETGTGYIRLEGVDENNERRLIDPDKVAALSIGNHEIPLAPNS